MNETHVIAILDRSAGNAETGEAWQETAIFPVTAQIEDVLRWAIRRTGSYQYDNFHSRLQLTICQQPFATEPPRKEGTAC